jgi:GT2 family glycosyltransferase
VIYTFIAFDPAGGKDVGEAYNRCMALLPSDDDWACFIDHDAMWTTYSWYQQLIEITRSKPGAGCFTALTNRTPSIKPTQTIGDPSNHDMIYQRRLGRSMAERCGIEILEYPDGLISGVVMLVRKSTWNEIKFTSGLFGVDCDFHKALQAAGKKVYLMTGVYVYHWCREKLISS